MPEIACRASMFLSFLDSRQGNAGMTDGALDSRLRGNDKIGSFIQLRKGLGSLYFHIQKSGLSVVFFECHIGLLQTGLNLTKN